jgi:hypothetical protein
MLYYNLYSLSAGVGTGYNNFMDRDITYSFPHLEIGQAYGSFAQPVTIDAYHTIDASNIINSNADVDYHAGVEVHLGSGFHAIPGCEFHAYVDPFQCDGGTYRMTIANNNSSSENNLQNVVAYNGQTTFVNYSKGSPKGTTESGELETTAQSSIEDNTASPNDLPPAVPVKPHGILIQPNPNNGSFEVVISGLEKTTGKITLLTIVGNPILQQQITGISTKIDISGQSKGIYYVKIENECGVTMQKIIYQ